MAKSKSNETSGSGHLCTGISQNADSRAGDIDELVQRWNHRATVWSCSDRENYINGDVKFFFEYRGCSKARHDALGWGQGHDIPNNIPTILAEPHSASERKVRNLRDDHVARYPCVISRWNKELVSVEYIRLMDEVEKFISAKLTVRFQVNKSLKEGWGDPLGQSVLYGYVKPCGGFTERELDVPQLPFLDQRGDDIPVGMIQGATQVVDRVSTDHSGGFNDGFVLFGERGALAGLCICFKDVGERAFFAEQFVQLDDVFRCPINL
jgi:hypothetical protein